MPRGDAQKRYRENMARIGLEIGKEEKAGWDEYAQAQGMPTGRMVRACVARCMALDGFKPENSTNMQPLQDETIKHG